MIFEQIRIGGDRNFAYLIGDEATKQAAVVDPAYNQEMVRELLKSHGLELVYIINTHGHHDHAGGNDPMRRGTDAKIVAHPDARPDLPVGDGQELSLGELTLKFLHTPGHTADGICVVVGDKVVTGDTLFVGKVGGTWSRDDAQIEYDTLHTKLMTLPEELEVHPGHDYGVKPTSTIGEEKANNPFLQQATFDDFLYLKEHWAEYKAEHGIQ